MALQCCNGFCHKTARISISIIFPSFLSLPPTLFPISPLLFVPDHQAELPVLNSNFPLAICFTYGNVCVSALCSQFFPSSPFPVCPHICSLCLHLYSCPSNRFTNTIFLDIKYKHYYIIFIFIFFLLSSLCLTSFKLIQFTIAASNYFLFLT